MFDISNTSIVRTEYFLGTFLTEVLKYWKIAGGRMFSDIFRKKFNRKNKHFLKIIYMITQTLNWCQKGFKLVL